MKIGVEDINHNAMRLIVDLETWDIAGHSDIDDHLRIMTLGYIRGITDLADELKKVLAE